MGTNNRETFQEDDSRAFAVEDYVQLACTLRRSIKLSLLQPGGAGASSGVGAVVTGGVVVNQGKLWAAWDAQGEGPAAFKRWIGTMAVIRVERLHVADIGPRTIRQDWQRLLLQAAVERDGANSPIGAAVPLVAPVLDDRSEPSSDPASEEADDDAEVGTTLYWRTSMPDLGPVAHLPTPVPETERPVAFSVQPVQASQPETLHASAPPRGSSGEHAFDPRWARSRGLLGAAAGWSRQTKWLAGAVGLATLTWLVVHLKPHDSAPERVTPSAAAERYSGGAVATEAAKVAVVDSSGVQVTGAAATGVPSAAAQSAAADNTTAAQNTTADTTAADNTTADNTAGQPSDTSNPVSSAAVRARVVNVHSRGPLGGRNLSRLVTGVADQFATCYRWAAQRAAREGLGPVHVVVHLDESGKPSKSAAQGGQLQGLNSCVSGVASRLAAMLGTSDGPNELRWIVVFEAP